MASRWLGVRLEFIGNLVIFFAALFAVVSRDQTDPGLVGLSLSYALTITNAMSFLVSQVMMIMRRKVANLEHPRGFSSTALVSAIIRIIQLICVEENCRHFQQLLQTFQLSVYSTNLVNDTIQNLRVR